MKSDLENYTDETKITLLCKYYQKSDDGWHRGFLTGFLIALSNDQNNDDIELLHDIIEMRYDEQTESVKSHKIKKKKKAVSSLGF